VSRRWRRYPLHEREVLVTACGRICMHRKRINVSTVLAGQKLGVKEVDEGIWIVSATCTGTPPAFRGTAQGTIEEEKLGWTRGFEPPTTGITIRDSTVELRPPRRCLLWPARQDSNL
jgi:hypothetical protein